MSQTATQRANALEIPLSDRDGDAADATYAANLFTLDWRLGWFDRVVRGFHDRLPLPPELGERTYRPNVRALAVYRVLGMVVWDDGFSIMSQREIAQRLGWDIRQVSRAMRRLKAFGIVRVHKLPAARRLAAAYELRPFMTYLRGARKLREPRPAVRAILESVHRRAALSAESVHRRAALSAESVHAPTLLREDSLKDSPGERVCYRKGTGPERTAKTPPIIPDLTWERRRRLELRCAPHGCSPVVEDAMIKLERYRALRGLA